MSRYFGVTGTPGTGKKTVSPIIAELLGVRCAGLNEVARSAGLLDSNQETTEVDPAALRRILLKKVKPPALLHGHLLPSVLRRNEVDFVVVLRCEPSILKSRLEERGYSKEKVEENLEAELIGVCLSESLSVFGAAKVFQVDTSSSSPRTSARRALEVTSRKIHRDLDWLKSYDTPDKLRSLLSVGMTDPARI